MADEMQFGAESGPDQIYVVDRWSQYQWRRYVEGEETAQDLLKNGGKRSYSFPRFCRETFTRLFADDVRPVDRMKPEDQWAANAHRELGDLPDFDRLRRRCRADRITAGTAAVAFAEVVLQKLPPMSSENPEQLREQIRGLLQFAKNLAATNGVTKEVDDLVSDLRHEGQEAVHRALDHARAVDVSELRGVLRGACHAAHRAVDQVDIQIGAFCGWGGGPSAEQTVGVEVKAELARYVARSEKLQALAREAGRLRRIAAAKQRTRVDQAREEVVEIELGADIDRVLPSELVLLADPWLSLEFARRFCERGLLQYKLGGKEALGRGPLVVCIDESSSMEGAKEIWAKGLALALLQVATTQHRWCRVVSFNSTVVDVRDWHPGKVDPLELVRSMERFHGGGTSLEAPLTSARESIESHRKLRRSDVVLITDGESEVGADFIENWKEARRRLEFACYAVHVDAPGGIAPRVFAELADVVIGLADLANDGLATDAVFGSI